MLILISTKRVLDSKFEVTHGRGRDLNGIRNQFNSPPRATNVALGKNSRPKFGRLKGGESAVRFYFGRFAGKNKDDHTTYGSDSIV